ncbi:hypothetical protein ACHAPG_007080 [Botrytis cinerea]
MTGNYRRPFKLFSSRGDSYDDPMCPPPYDPTAAASSQTGGRNPIFDFPNMNTSMDTGSSDSSPPDDKSPSNEQNSRTPQKQDGQIINAGIGSRIISQRCVVTKKAWQSPRH